MATFTIYSRFDSSVVVLQREGRSLREVVLAAIADKADLSRANLSRANLSRANLSGADLSRANLSGADLSRANLWRANLSRANLWGANLSGANLSRADLSRADLSWANLSGADLSRADLSWADLSGADLSGADLSRVKLDLWDVLLRAPAEIDGLLLALREGRVDGSVYQGECACLVGTIANVADKPYTQVPFIEPNSSRPAERWFLGIRKGDTPDNSQLVKLTAEWIEEFQGLFQRAVAIVSAEAAK